MTSRNVWYIRICISAHPWFSVLRCFRSSLCFSKAWPKCTHNVNVTDSHVTRSWYETLLCWTWILNLYILCILYAKRLLRHLSLKLRWERPDISATQEGPPSWSIKASNGFGGLGSCAWVYPGPTANSASLIQTCPRTPVVFLVSLWPFAGRKQFQVSESLDQFVDGSYSPWCLLRAHRGTFYAIYDDVGTVYRAYNRISSVNFKNVRNAGRNFYRNQGRGIYGSLRTCPPFEVGKCFRNLGENYTCHRFHSQDLHIQWTCSVTCAQALLKS